MALGWMERKGVSTRNHRSSAVDATPSSPRISSASCLEPSSLNSQTEASAPTFQRILRIRLSSRVARPPITETL